MPEPDKAKSTHGGKRIPGPGKKLGPKKSGRYQKGYWATTEEHEQLTQLLDTLRTKGQGQ